MQRMVLHPVNPQVRLVKQAIEVFQKGGLVVYPTDSGYSVGCSALHRDAVERLYHLKRAITKYVMALMVPEFSNITDFAIVETSAYRYMKNKLPGPYTFILPATKHGKKILDVKRAEIGVRMPDHPFFQVLHEHYHDPILNTAARIDEEDDFIDPDDIEEKFGKQVDLIIDMGVVPVNPTSVISLLSGAPEMIRQGAGEI